MTPQDLGCSCDVCPLKDRKPVTPAQVRAPKSKRLAIISDYPGQDETKTGSFFTGPSGDLVNRRFLDHLNIPRSEIHFSNALLCWPGRSLPPKEWKQAVACCRPRLSRELEQVKPRAVLAMGPRALQSLTGKSQHTKFLGTPMRGEDFFVGGRKKGTKVADFTGLDNIVPTLQPAMLFRDSWQYVPIIRCHVERAWKLATGELAPWEWGPLYLDPDAEMVRALEGMLARSGPMSVDIETTGIDPWEIDITRIGFADKVCAISVPWCDWQGVEGVRERSFVGSQAQYIATLTLDLLESSRLKVFQNGIFDRTVFRVHEIECRPPFFDTLYAHMIYSPGTKHDLGFQAGQELHAPAWKAEFRGFKKENEK